MVALLALPKELLMEILIKLPAKTLLRSLLVSKAWYSLIKDDCFIKQHLHRNLKSNYSHHLFLTHSSVPIFPDDHGLEFSQYTDPDKFLNHPQHSKPPLEGIGGIERCSSGVSDLRFCGTCNGIVCLFYPKQNYLGLFNPTTKSCRFFPDIEDMDIRSTSDDFVNFGFGYDCKNDDADDFLNFGFGYDSKNDDADDFVNFGFGYDSKNDDADDFVNFGFGNDSKNDDADDFVNFGFGYDSKNDDADNFVNFGFGYDSKNDDADNFVNFGFGYDSKNDDYKVLRITQSTWSNHQINTDVRVYNLRRNSWQIVYNQINTIGFYRKKHSVLVKEGLHYFIWDSIKKKSAIAKLDVVTESFSYLELPDDYDHDALVFNLANLGGKLSCVAGYNLFQGVDLWIMEECGKEYTWVKFLNIKTGIGNNDLMEFISETPDVKPVALSNNGELIFAVSGSLLYWYDTIKRRVTQVRECEGLGCRSLHAVTYVESLVSVDDKGICNRWLPRRPSVVAQLCHFN